MKKNEMTASLFLQECTLAFSFLITEYGFSKPKVVNKNNLFKVIFYNKNLAIQCSYDVRDDMNSIYITKLSKGKIPDCYRVNKSGEVVSEQLFSILIAKGVRKFKSDIIVDNKDIFTSQKSLREDLLGDAVLLKRHCKDILKDSVEIFETLSTEDGDQF